MTDTLNQTPAEKAAALIKNFYPVAAGMTDKVITESAKICAIKAVNELIEEHTFKSPISWNVKRKEYWKAVREAIKVL